MTRTARQKRIRAAQRAQLAPRPGCPHPAKGAYADEAAVSAALRRSRVSGLPIRVYPCPCGAWHLTSKPDRRRGGVA
ncbi:hypothetical protein HOU70_gp47 [Arthrobacter phage Liebe]|uniref:Uncharacterized protein n=2 Tax=Arthrobacter virus Liebe TaxID=2734245 RepID=A0A3G2KHT0_9CAUD|nr:hypothetical protein HOU70_gp47 [Arthrobacter phage Liebe]AYN58528.1 hypothetical protein PBI_MAUREEN_47 [Arthrobacter phage Maureen]AZF93780.1 hypothetical protein PBI_LIEBE_47 [Arthrobacter phage Liebe]